MFNRNQSLPYILLKNKRHCDLFLEFIVFSRSSEVRFVQISVISSGFCRFGFRMYTFSCGTVLLPSKISSSCRSDYLYANSFFIVTVTTYFITNNAYRIMHYIPRNVSVRPHQVSHCVRTFDAVLRNNLYRFIMLCTSSYNFFIRSIQMSDAFYKSSFFFIYSTRLCGDQMQ